MPEDVATRCREIQEAGTEYMNAHHNLRGDSLEFVEIRDRTWRLLHDEALDLVHYSGSCQRVGRCMRLAVVEKGQWAGGIVLGSTFPNILVRDKAVGLRQFVTDFRNRGLTSPWSSANRLYWDALQKVVNHARTFVFPGFQGRGIGIRAHGLLLGEGVRLWEAKYNDEVYALDTLCTENDSKLFSRNAWKFVGRTKGYSSDPKALFSKRLEVKNQSQSGIKNNVALTREGDATRWCVWVRMLRTF